MADAKDEEVKSPLNYAQKLQKQATEGQQVLDQHRARLMNLMTSRQNMPFDPALMALAKGLLAPTKTGSFGESFGYGASAYAEEMEKQLRRQQEEAKMAYELEMAAQQQKRDLMGDQLLADMFAGEMPGAMPAPASAAAAPVVGEAPIALGDVAAEAPAAVPAVGAPAEVAEPKKPSAADVVKVMPELSLPNAIPRNAIAQASDDQIAIISAFNPKVGKVLNDYRTAFRQGRELQIKEINLAKELQQLELSKQEGKRKEREVVAKEESVKRFLPGVGSIEMPMAFWNELGKAENFDQIQTLYKKHNLPLNIVTGTDGMPRFMSESEIEINKERQKARFSQPPIEVPIPELGTGKYVIDRVTYDDYRTAKAKGGKALQKFFNENFPEANIAIPSAGGTPGAKVTSVEERKAEAAGAEETAKLEAKTASEKKANVISMGDNARERILLAEQLNKFATDPSKAKIMAILEKATPESALGKMLSEGISVGTLRVGLPQLREAVIQVGGSEQDVRNFQQLANIYTQLMMMNGNYFAGQGAVSDYERRMQQQMGGTVQDTPAVAQARAQYVITRARFDKAVSNMFQDWLESNPGKTYDQFKRKSSQYQKLEETYANRVRAIGDRFFPDLSIGQTAEPRTQNAPTRAPSSPPARGSSSAPPAGGIDRFMQ
jgi:hypothetical protein